MSATAGKDAKIEVNSSTGQSSGTELTEAKSVTFDQTNETLDVTAFPDDAIDRIYGLSDASCSITMNYDGSSTPQSNLESARDSKTKVSIIFYQDGSNKVYGDFLVESISDSAEVDGISEREVSLVGSGGLTRA